MATEYKLSYTATDINAKLGKIDSLASKSDLEGKSDVNHMHSIESIEGLQEAVGAAANIIESITVNGEEVIVTDKAVNIEIPEQIKADWTQTDETALDFIKNKPILATSEEIKALFD
jgi:uncharacterized Rossmann fold enzyme